MRLHVRASGCARGLLALVAGCVGSGDPVDRPGPSTVPWSAGLPPLAGEIGPTRGLVPLRAIVHLHSPWSHDACDGHGVIDGAPDEACLADLRRGLCETSVDLAFVTDHPAHAADQDYDDLMLTRSGDSPIEVGGVRVGNRIPCDGGHTVSWLPGIEDELMPVALDHHVADSAEENDRIYNQVDAETVGHLADAGGFVLAAHTEGRERADLEALQDAGLGGVELFNLHAMFAPDKREEDLGLDPFDWLTAIAPFTDPAASGEPDLLFLGVLQEQAPSVARWEELLARGPMVGVAGSDSHQNVMPLLLRDGERGDAYRRTFRWFGNVVLTEGAPEDAVAAEDALRAGRVYAAFEALGTPRGFDFHLVDPGGAVWEMGSEAPAGTLHVGCPTLSERSPRGEEDPEVLPLVTRDGAKFADRCGDIPTAGPGVYRVRIDVVPHHLRPFLGDDPEPWLVPYPWVYGNAIRVR